MTARLGLVLSGGGSRGLAHAGVLEVLADAGIEVSCISGTSAGALVGALHAAGYRANDVLRFFERTTPFHLAHVASLRKPGVLDTAKVEREFREFFPDDSFEALSKPLFVTATDLVEGRLRVFSSGPLIRPLLASASIPVIFTPTPFLGTLFVDGGLVDNFPVEPLAGRCRRILGVHANPLRSVAPETLDDSISVIQRAVDIAMWLTSERDFRRADLVLRPPELAAYSTIDPRRHEEILEIGRRAALDRLDDLRRLVEAG